MNSTTYTPQQCSDVVQLYAAVQSNPPDRQTIIKVMANTFISGMTAQDRLTAPPSAPAEPVRPSA